MPQIVPPPDGGEKEHPGFQIVRWLRPGGAALVLLVGILFVVQCFMTGREPVKGYQPKHDTAYYTAHLEALAEELNEDLLPQVDEHARAEAGDTVVTVYLPKETYITTRAAVLRYYDTSLFEFQES
jgi:hypothetical protein